MNLKYTFEFVEMGGEVVAVAVGDGAENLHGVLKLNSSGAHILKLLQEGHTRNSLIKMLSSCYENSQDEICENVDTELAELEKCGVIDSVDD